MRYLLRRTAGFIASAVLLASPSASAQMTQDQMHRILSLVGTDVVITGNRVAFNFDGLPLLRISDVTADRMRIVTPVSNLESVDYEDVLLALAANYHSVLDVRYALSEGVIYSAFIHPLSPLTEEQLVSAVQQVATASNTFGEAFTSGALFFNQSQGL